MKTKPSDFSIAQLRKKQLQLTESMLRQAVPVQKGINAQLKAMGKTMALFLESVRIQKDIHARNNRK